MCQTPAAKQGESPGGQNEAELEERVLVDARLRPIQQGRQRLDGGAQKGARPRGGPGEYGTEHVALGWLLPEDLQLPTQDSKGDKLALLAQCRRFRPSCDFTFNKG